MNISFDSEDLITEIKNDILEFGNEAPCVIWAQQILGKIIIKNYDFCDINEVSDEEIGDCVIKRSTLGETLELLEKQNEIIQFD